MKKSKVLRWLTLALIGLFCLSSYKVYNLLTAAHNENVMFEELLREVQSARQVKQDEGTEPIFSAAPTGISESRADAHTPPRELAATDATGVSESTPPPGQTMVSAPESPTEPASGVTAVSTPRVTAVPAPTEVPPILAEYEVLYKRNHHLFGWLDIPGTTVNYPVMHVPNQPEYYLHRAFDGSYSYSGVPFLAGECFIGCGNYIVYGHHMKNGTMFAGMLSYTEEAFWREHPTIRFDTLYASESYEVIAVFYGKVYPADEPDVFRYYAYADLTDPEVFAAYIEQVKAAALYDTGISAEYGDQLLTLSTCSYHTADGRFIVVARRIS